MNNQEHLDIAREVGQQGIVLLTNEDDFFPTQGATVTTASRDLPCLYQQ